jgi:hypothetical protein
VKIPVSKNGYAKLKLVLGIWESKEIC